MRLGYNTYCLRALRWADARHMEFAAAQKLDALFLQDSPDPLTQDPAHWKAMRAMAEERGLLLQTGGGGLLPKAAEGLPAAIETLRKNIVRAEAMGSKIVRGVMASNRASFPVAPEEAMEWGVRILRAVKSELSGRGMKVSIEVHKDLHAWELKQVIEAAGADTVGVYMDTGNPVFLLEHPLTSLETLAPYVVCAHLRDSVIYEHRRGVAVQWVPLGEGVVDFKEWVGRLKELCPAVPVYNKPITGRPPEVLPYLEPEWWKTMPKARAGELARFLDLARKGRPYEGHMVIEDLQGRQTPPQFAEAVGFQQKDHVERGLEYAKSVLGLGEAWRRQ